MIEFVTTRSPRCASFCPGDVLRAAVLRREAFLAAGLRRAAAFVLRAPAVLGRAFAFFGRVAFLLVAISPLRDSCSRRSIPDVVGEAKQIERRYAFGDTCGPVDPPVGSCTPPCAVRATVGAREGKR